MAPIEDRSPRSLFGREPRLPTRRQVRPGVRGPALAALLAGLLLASLPPGPRPAVRAQVAAPAEPTVVELADLETLRARFDQDLGKLRLILLLSPT